MSRSKKAESTRVRKLTDDSFVVRCASGRKGVLREEVWVDASNAVTRYNLAFINFELFQKDNGRVLGYDNAHGRHERHYMGKTSVNEFSTYEALVQRFYTEVEELRKGA